VIIPESKFIYSRVITSRFYAAVHDPPLHSWLWILKCNISIVIGFCTLTTLKVIIFALLEATERRAIAKPLNILGDPDHRTDKVKILTESPKGTIETTPQDRSGVQ